MSTLSSEFVFAPIFSMEVSSDGGLVKPFPGASIGPRALDQKFVYVFGENIGGQGQFQPIIIYKVETISGGDTFPVLRLVKDTDDNGDPVLDDEDLPETIVLPTTTSSGADDVKYFFVCLDRFLDPASVDALAAMSSRLPLPVVSLSDSAPKLFVDSQGNYSSSPQPGARRCVLVMDPYFVGENLSATFKIRCNDVIEFTQPQAVVRGTEAAEAAAAEKVKQRLDKHALALEIKALQDAGKDFSGKLKSGSGSLSQTLKDMDPNEPDGELGKLIEKRENFANALINFTRSELWDILEKDARLTDARGEKFYAQHLRSTCKIHEYLPLTELGTELWLQICIKFSMEGSDEGRGTPDNGLEEMAMRFIFSEKDSIEPADPWKEPAILGAANSVFGFYGALTKVVAAAALQKVGDSAGGVFAPDTLEAFAEGAIRNKGGLTAYRWAYHLRNNFLVESVTVKGVPKTVTWVDGGQRIAMDTADIVIDVDEGQFTAKFPASKFNFAHVGRGLTVASYLYTIMTLSRSIEKKKDSLGIDILKTGSATLSLAGDSFIAGLMVKPQTIASGRGAAVVKWFGIAGAGLGAVVSGLEAAKAFDNGEGDVAFTLGAGAAVGGFIAGWGAAAALGLVASGPPGWIVLAGAGVGVLVPIIAGFLQDDPLEEMVEHSVFGTQHGLAHDAPKVALCAGDKFNFWAGESRTSLKRQRLGFANLIWAFSVKGDSLNNAIPTVEFSPPRMLEQTCFEVKASLTWKSGSNTETLNGTVRLFPRSEKVQNRSGDRFAGENATFVGLNTTKSPAKHHVPWIIEPEDTAKKTRIQSMTLHEATLEIKLLAQGPDDTEMVFPRNPATGPGVTFTYVLAKRVPKPRGSGLRTRFNTDEVASSIVYNPP